MPESILILDNYDSFTFNLLHLVEQFDVTAEVHRNDEMEVAAALKFDRIILSPGPGLPNESGRLMEIVAAVAGVKPMLGVCLGLQAIVEHYGGRLANLQAVQHGVQSQIHLVDPIDSLFTGLPKQFAVGRYHSWVADKAQMPTCLCVTAADESGEIMAISHNSKPIKGVQFHPESIMTDHGKAMVENFLGLPSG